MSYKSMFSLSVRPVRRLHGESFVEEASYIGRARTYDARTGETYDVTHLKDCLYSQVFLPDNAPQSFRNRTIRCNAVERAQKRYDSRLGRTLWAALPNEKEFSLDEYIKIAEAFVDMAFLRLGMIADVAIHKGKHPLNPEKNNPHLHILVPDRPVDRYGFCAKKDRKWNKRDVINLWRKCWEHVLNRAYERIGLDIKVSCESLEVQGISPEERVPQRHVGRMATSIERQRKPSIRGTENERIIADNENKKRIREQELENSLEFELSR